MLSVKCCYSLYRYGVIQVLCCVSASFKNGLFDSGSDDVLTMPGEENLLLRKTRGKNIMPATRGKRKERSPTESEKDPHKEEASNAQKSSRSESEKKAPKLNQEESEKGRAKRYERVSNNTNNTSHPRLGVKAREKQGMYNKNAQKGEPDPTAIGGSFEGTPLDELEKVMKKSEVEFKKAKNGNVLMWIRNKDFRAFERASQAAKSMGTHVIALHVISPGDYKSHGRGARRIDFMMRNVKELRSELKEKNIPLVVRTITPRKTVPKEIISFCDEFNITKIYANIEYEVDELRRDAVVVHLARESGKAAFFVHDCIIVPPGMLLTKEGKPYSVYGPWFKKWVETVNENDNLLETSEDPEANDESVRKDKSLHSLFEEEIPSEVEGYECADAEKMAQLWPAGYHSARESLGRFLEGKKGKEADDIFQSSKVKEKKAAVENYPEGRNRPDVDGTSRLSPYLAAGVISPREVVQKARKMNKGSISQGGKENGFSNWISEVAWRDFYAHVIVAWPRVVMGRAYNLAMESVCWEYEEDQVKAWKEGNTGYPIVDAAMRQMRETGFMHNRCRMITAMFLVKDLMVDWKNEVGEAYFMQHLMDADFASNNGGWQWSASTGTDPQPYFRIFNPFSQSEKSAQSYSDPDGAYIKRWVPELKSLSGKALHDPFHKLDKASFKKLGYPEPIVDHNEARKRALRRFKTPGEK
ncbi:hypothetical protein PROFUN_15963 [Planoprotostelium fungivorum]|uniref:Photolyase/cryptochrome alpha/beta domain-containing protein n=1 Tax=Planoprotostelium fungivorum TaxID=1890364 RepID=A0A2P6MU22_9EUKA|nr:hypothetical protein PROFUN_15963 [Planoprotostelium fungivorum]